MTCEEALILISGHIDGENSPEEECQLSDHLKNCSSCRAILSAYQELDHNVAALEEEPPAVLVSGVMERIATMPPSLSKKRRSFLFGGGTAVAAAAAVLLILLSSGKVALPQQQAPQDTDHISGSTRDISGISAEAALAENASASDSDIADSAPDISTFDAAASASESGDTSSSITAFDSSAAAASSDGTAVASPDSASDETSLSPNLVLVNPKPSDDESLLVELVDNPDAPAATTISELAQLTAETDGEDGAVQYLSDVKTVRLIVDAYDTQYTIRTPSAWEQASDATPCILLIVAS